MCYCGCKYEMSGFGTDGECSLFGAVEMPPDAACVTGDNEIAPMDDPYYPSFGLPGAGWIAAEDWPMF